MPKTPQVEEPKGPMEIVPHEPVMRYQVKGYPLNSMDAFIVYCNGTEIYSLTTNNKTIVGAINELKALLDNIDLSDYATKEELEAYAKLTDLDNYVTLTEYNTTIEQINAAIADLISRMTTAEGDIDTLQTDVENIKKKLPNDPLFHVNTVFTDPRYFTEKNFWGTFTTDNYVTFSYDINVVQDLQLEDGIIEVLNLNFLRNVVLDFDKMPTHFYIPASVDFYDDNGVYTGSKQFMLDAEWTVEMNSFDLSVYFRGEIPNTNEHTTMKVSAVVPYTIKEGVTL